MAKQLILCEKPSVGMDFAKGLGNNFARKDGYLENNNYIITWAHGHLCELKTPEEYNPELKKWSLDTLPIFPEKFEYKIIKESAKQFKVIKELIHKQEVSSIVIATDCGREGELIARLILLLSGNKKPLYRFWTSEALTPEVIQREIKNLKPAKEFDRLYQSALARQWADWLVGMNGTRAVTVKNNGELFSIGRVQTAVLSLIAQREKEIKNFKPQTFYNVVAEFEKGKDTYKGTYFRPRKEEAEQEEVEQEGEEKQEESINSKYAILRKEDAEKIAKEVSGKKGIIKSIQSKISSEKPPLLFSLTTLQQEANKKFGYSADKTLSIAQSLYEKHLISYPRTESQYLDPGYAGEIKKIVGLLSTAEIIKFDKNKCNVNTSNKRIFDLSKLTDHHALIPQQTPKSALTEDERKIYELICKRFISAFYPDCKYKNTTVITEVAGYLFETKGKQLIDPGWREIYGGLTQDIILPATILEKDTVNTKKAESVGKQTQPPPRYTDASLLNIMANAHRVVTNPELKKILRENAGIGTPATRAQILKVLQDRKYVYKQGKQFVPTEKGIFLIEMLEDEKIASPEYTAVWEQELEKIARGESKDVGVFLNSIKNYVVNFIDRTKRASNVWEKKSFDYPKSYTRKQTAKKQFSKQKTGGYKKFKNAKKY